MALHLTPEEREELSHLLREGHSKAEIARRMGRDRGTIFRELKRNKTNQPYGNRSYYCAVKAQQLADKRRHACRTKKMQRPEIRRYVERHLKELWSPDQVAGRMRHEYSENTRMRISHQTIYLWIHQHDHRRRWKAYLRRHKMRIRRKRLPPGLTALANRPPVVETRERLGDWEGDTIVGAGQQGFLTSLVDRKSGYVLLSKVENRQSATVGKAIQNDLKKLPQAKRQSVTFDNGTEFAAWREMETRLGLSVYFTEPHSPWQRGSNEHLNGLVRQYLPKGTSFRHVSHRRVAQIANQLNDRPRKRHGYRTPREIFQQARSAALLS